MEQYKCSPEKVWFFVFKYTTRTVKASPSLHTASMQRSKKKKKEEKATAIQRGYKASVDKLLHILLPLIILNSFNESLSK